MMHILLVDDDDLIQASTEAILQVLGHRVTIASRGEEAISLLAGGLQVELVILDMNMPGLGGASTLPKIREINADVPVLLSTGRTDHHAQELAQAFPNVTLLAKPFGLAELRSFLTQLPG